MPFNKMSGFSPGPSLILPPVSQAAGHSSLLFNMSCAHYQYTDLKWAFQNRLFCLVTEWYKSGDRAEAITFHNEGRMWEHTRVGIQSQKGVPQTPWRQKRPPYLGYTKVLPRLWLCLSVVCILKHTTHLSITHQEKIHTSPNLPTAYFYVCDIRELLATLDTGAELLATLDTTFISR